jgi:hypothetical protein
MGRKCECGLSQSSFFEAHDKTKKRKWCVLCPQKPITAVSCRIRKKCSCGKAAPYMCLPTPSDDISKWCKLCPTKPSNAIYKISRKINMIQEKKLEFAAIILMQINRNHTHFTFSNI